jgi:predicted acylesterase/phospholipase RssA
MPRSAVALDVVGARYVSFAAAGTRGLCYLGLLDALEDALGADGYEAWRGALRGAAGTSAGACAALTLLLGLDRAARRQTLAELSDMRAVVRCPDVALLLREYGWEDGRAFKELVQRVLTRGGLSGDSTLGDFRRLLRQDLVCVCTDLRTGAPCVLSAETAPDVRVCDAVYASSCVPFVFAPARVKGGVLAIDGCLSCEMPEVFDEAETLFVSVDGAAAGQGDDDVAASWAGFVQGIVRCCSVAQGPRLRRLREASAASGRWLSLPHPRALCAGPAFDVSLDARGAEALHRAGYAETRDALAAGALARTAAAATTAYVRLVTLPVALVAAPTAEPEAGPSLDPTAR